jgi:FtsP/CotA-like multicopper oxidase with cupredoxin domain
MRQVGRVLAMMGLAVSVAACSTTGQGSGGLGESASQTIRDHPQTVAGAGVGAAGGAVVGGLAGGTKGAVIGGLLGGLAGGAIGNYVERREAALPETVSTPQTVSVPPSTTGTTGAAVVRVDQVHAQPLVVRPGDTVTLNATYTILSPLNQLVTVRETREVRLNGELVANPAVDVARQTGMYSSALPITLPTNARTGRYEVTTTVASGDRQSTSTTSFSVQ